MFYRFLIVALQYPKKLSRLLKLFVDLGPWLKGGLQQFKLFYSFVGCLRIIPELRLRDLGL